MKKWNYEELIAMVKDGLNSLNSNGFVDPGNYVVVYNGDHWAPLSFCDMIGDLITDPDGQRVFYPQDQCHSWFIATNDELASLWAEKPCMFRYYERDYSWEEGSVTERIERKEALRRMKRNHWIEVVYNRGDTFGRDLREPHVKWDGTKLIADAHYRGGSPFGEIEEEDLPF